MALQAREGIEETGDEKDDSRCDQAGWTRNKTNPLHGAHNNIHRGPHPVGREASDKAIEFGRGGTYPEKERDLDENKDE